MTTINDIHIGKVRNSAILNNNTRIIQTTNKISAFDFVFPFEIQNKAKILQALSVYTFYKTSHIIENHIIGVLNETHLLVKSAKVFPVEIIVRGYLAGSLWRLYKAQGPSFIAQEYGIKLPLNMVENQKLPSPMLTPSTKAVAGHDIPISHAQAAELVGNENLWKEIETKALELFLFGQKLAHEKGLILVDTKYEMGLFNNKLILVDEVHTPDSSRYWYKEDEQKTNPKQISKEFFREELIKIIGLPENLTVSPLNHPFIQNQEIVEELKSKVFTRYQELFNVFTGLQNTDDVYKTNKLQFIPWPVEKNIFDKTANAYTLPSKVLVVGNGGRDYVLFSELCKLAEVSTVYCAAGNRNWQSQKYAPCPKTSIKEIATFAKQNDIGLVIAGPEAPIAQGLEQYCSEYNIPVLAPSLECASLETSKILCKTLIQEAGIKTARSKIVSWAELKTLPSKEIPCVIKYDSLANGKGVFIVKNTIDFAAAINTIENNLESWNKLSNDILTPTYSKIHNTPCFLIEEIIEGYEFSAIALCNGEHFRLLPIAKDYKRRNDNQKGPNTGGMGAIAPVALTTNLIEQVQHSFTNILKTLINKNTPYRGFLFAGFMVDKNNCAHLLEYNCRLGDPETQVLLPSLGREFYAELFATAKKQPFFAPEKNGSFFNTDGLNRIFVVGASPEYPDGTPPKRQLVLPHKNTDNNFVECIPSALEENNMTSGGRVFGVLAAASTFEQAKKFAYNYMEHTYFLNQDESKTKPHFRTDIGE